MKYHSIIYIITLLLASISISSASPQQVWQIDISPHLGDRTLRQYNDPAPYVCEDGNVLVTAELDESGLCILIYDENGNFIDIDDFDGQWFDQVQGQGPSTYFTLALGLSSGYTNRYYEITNGTLVATGMPYYRCAPMRPRRNELVTLNGTMLTKFVHIPKQPTVFAPASTISGENLIISWSSESGEKYILQRSTNLTEWINSNVEFDGTGSTMSWSTPTTNSSTYYRVIIP